MHSRSLTYVCLHRHISESMKHSGLANLTNIRYTLLDDTSLSKAQLNQGHSKQKNEGCARGTKT